MGYEKHKKDMWCARMSNLKNTHQKKSKIKPFECIKPMTSLGAKGEAGGGVARQAKHSHLSPMQEKESKRERIWVKDFIGK
jgi:hypothetical protein